MTRRKSELPRAVLLCVGLLLGAALLGMGQSRAGETPYCRMELPPAMPWSSRRTAALSRSPRTAQSLAGCGF